MTFRDAASARKALRRSHVHAVDAWLEPDAIAEKCAIGKWPEIRPTDELDHLSTINDDCLEHICSFLDQDGLLNFSKASQRVKSFARLFVKRLDIDLIENPKSEIEDFLQEFGSHISSLQMAGWKLGEDEHNGVIGMVAKYCSKDCLRKIRIEYSDPRASLEEIRSSEVFSNLIKLRWAGCEVMDELLPLCPSLKTVCLSDITVPIPSGIETAHVQYGFAGHFEEFREPLGRFIGECSNLKELRIPFMPSRAISFIVDHLPHLERLAFSVSYFAESAHDVLSMRNLKNLKRLEIMMISRESAKMMLSAVAEIDALEEISIRCNSPLDADFFAALNRSNGFKKIALPRCKCDQPQLFLDFLKSAEKRHPNLEHLSLPHGCDRDGDLGDISFWRLALTTTVQLFPKLKVVELPSLVLDFKTIRNIVEIRSRMGVAHPLFLDGIVDCDEESIHFLRFSPKCNNVSFKQLGYDPQLRFIAYL